MPPIAPNADIGAVGAIAAVGAGLVLDILPGSSTVLRCPLIEKQ